MNNDDTFSDNPGGNQPDAPAAPAATAALEARVVAWVLGEASPFEVAELARLVAETPELAIFKRRIEAVHGLAGEAARPPADATLRLSGERRAKVIAVIGSAAAGDDQQSEEVARAIPRWVQVWNKWALPMAACITVCALLGAVLFPAIGAAKKSKRLELTAISQNYSESEDKGVTYSAPVVAFKPAASVVQEKSQMMADQFSDQKAEVKAKGFGTGGATVTGSLSGDSVTDKDAALDRLQASVDAPLPQAAAVQEQRMRQVADKADAPASNTLAYASQKLQQELKQLPSGRQLLAQEDRDDLPRDQPELAKMSDHLLAVAEQPLLEAQAAAALAAPAFDESLRVETVASQEPVSTFSLHVGDASFLLAKAALARGEAPEPASIRPEEFYNAFDYGDPAPAAGEPVNCRVEQSAHPFMQQRNLVRIAMKVPATGRGAGQPLRLTVLLDTSGSMEREDRAAEVRAALTSLVSLLGADDRITLVGFARQPRLLADRVPGDQAAGLVDLVAKTPFEGGTNLEEALKLAGDLARGQFTAAAQNRIVVLSDGAANLGVDDPARLSAMVAALRQQGIAFDACGVGADGLDDTVLEALTRKGDGRYTVINSPEEADAGFAKKLAGAFRPAAENVKVQVRFNPSRVARYRLIGFEQHRLKTEDFRNDRVDAAELAAEEAAVALYQVEVLPGGEGELGEVSVRFRDVATGNMVERSWPLAYAPQPPAFDRATPSMKLAGASAFLAEKLRGGALADQIRLDELAPVVNALRGDYAHDARVQDFVTMVAQARRLTGE